MNIRLRLTLLFVSIVGLISVISSLVIYLFSADNRKESFNTRLENKSIILARILARADQIDSIVLDELMPQHIITLPEERTVVLNESDKVVYASDDDIQGYIDDVLLEQIRTEKSIRFRADPYEAVGTYFPDPESPLIVIVAAYDLYGYSKLSNLRTSLLIVVAISLILSFAAGWYFSGKALHPMATIVQEVDRITINSLNLRVNEGNSNDEIAQLAKTFNNMLDRLEKSFLIQKDFIANASHELRTPLTTITGQMEVVLMNDHSIQEYKEVLNSLLEDVRRLTQISNRLLMHAQADSEQARRNFRKVRLDDVLWKAQEEIKRWNPGYTILIALDPELDDELKMTISGDEQLIKAAFMNLIDNNCKYSPDHKSTINLRFADGYALLEFTDQGVGIPEDDLQNILKPFHRGTNTERIEGYGIGLSLAQRIISLHGGALDVNSRIHEGTTFIVKLPVFNQEPVAVN